MAVPAEIPGVPAKDGFSEAESPLTDSDVNEIARTVQQISSDSPGDSPVGSQPAVGPRPPSDIEKVADPELVSCYWDASAMAPLNAISVAALARLRAFRPPPFPLWDRLPLNRRAAVMMLLYADRRGDLRVVITMRAANLRSFSGHAALPGGKADTLEETPYQIARREAWEEIGLPMDDAQVPAPFRIEHLCYLPFNLAKTELVVRPSVAFLHAAAPPVPAVAAGETTAPAGEALIPRLDAREVAAVFSAPFRGFLRAAHEDAPPGAAGAWYEGSWVHWHERPWRLHNFYVPVAGQRVARPGAAAAAEVPGDAGRYKVWGMTARILVDAATVAYGEEPEFEHNSHFGDEEVIEGLEKMGRLTAEKRPGGELTSEDLRMASAATKM